ARCGHHAGDQIRKNRGQDEVAPAIPGAEAVDLRGFLEVRGNGHGAGDDVEEDVPLRAEEHQEHGRNLEAFAEAKQKKKNNRKQGGGGNGGGHLHKRLRDARPAGIRTDGDADGNGPERAKDEAIQAEDDGSAADKIEQSGLCGAGTFDLFELELVRPNDDGPPNELIEENDDGDHGGEAPENRTGVAIARRRLKKRAKAGEAKVALAEDEHFAGHEKKPAAGDGHHGIPDEADGGKREVQLGEALPAAEAVEDRDFIELARDGLQ